MVIVAFSRYDSVLDYKYAHTALGGGNVGLMGGLSLWACPISIAEILPTYMDGSSAFPGTQGDSAQVYSAANEIIGAATHELGHAMGRPHEGVFDLSIMQRGFDRMYRKFTLARPDGTGWANDRIGNWSPESAAAFADDHPWFELPPPVARFEAVMPQALPEALSRQLISFDQPVSGVSIDDFSLRFDGEIEPGFAAGASIVQVSDRAFEILIPASSTSACGDYELSLQAAGSGITSTAGLALYDDGSVRWTRVEEGFPVFGAVAATAVTSDSAHAEGILASTGGSAVGLTLFWGASDGGTSAGGWQNSISLGQVSRGLASVELAGLVAESPYRFRFRAINATGEVWSGLVQLVTSRISLLLPGAIASYSLPSSGAQDGLWFTRDFDDSSWARGASGLGYEQSGNDYEGLIATDLSAARNSSICVRTRFEFDAPEAASVTALTLKLKLKYDDGFVAWLNGVEVARVNAPDGVPAWNSAATALHPDADAATYEDLDLTPLAALLEDTRNVLAIHGFNDGVGSSDFLILPELVATRPLGSLPVAVPTLRPSLSPGGLVDLRFEVVAGHRYQMQFSRDLASWRDVGAGWVHTGATTEFTWSDNGNLAGGEPLDGRSRFYRLRVGVGG